MIGCFERCSCPSTMQYCTLLSQTQSCFSSTVAAERDPLRSRSANFRQALRSILLPSFSRAFFRDFTLRVSVTCGFSRLQPGRPVLLHTRGKSPHSPQINCRMVITLVPMTPSITSLPAKFRTAIEMLVHVHADIFSARFLLFNVTDKGKINVLADCAIAVNHSCQPGRFPANGPKFYQLIVIWVCSETSRDESPSMIW